jgi:hypothetical protein
VGKGVLLGDSDGPRLGSMKSKLVAPVLGLEVGIVVGFELGDDDGSALGLEVGLKVGVELGDADGVTLLGEPVGNLEEGDPEGLVVGSLLGLDVGSLDGLLDVGSLDGLLDVRSLAGLREEVGPAEGLKLREG